MQAVNHSLNISRKSVSHTTETLIAHGIICMHHHDPFMPVLQPVQTSITNHLILATDPKFLPPPRLQRGLSANFCSRYSHLSPHCVSSLCRDGFVVEAAWKMLVVFAVVGNSFQVGAGATGPCSRLGRRCCRLADAGDRPVDRKVVGVEDR